MLNRTLILASVFLFITTTMTARAEDGGIMVKVTPVPPNLSAHVAFTEPSGNKMLDAEETGKLILTLHNSGKGDAFDVRAQIKASGKTTGLEFDHDVNIGTVPAGGTVKKEIDLKAAEDVPTANISLTVEIREANGFEPNPMVISFKTKAFEPPKLVVADVGVSDQKGSGQIEPGAIVELMVRVQNIGRGNAQEGSCRCSDWQKRLYSSR